MYQLNSKDQQAFDNIFGTHDAKWAQGVNDCKNNAGLNSGDPEYRKGYYHQLKLESEQAKQRG